MFSPWQEKWLVPIYKFNRPIKMSNGYGNRYCCIRCGCDLFWTMGINTEVNTLYLKLYATVITKCYQCGRQMSFLLHTYHDKNSQLLPIFQEQKMIRERING